MGCIDKSLDAYFFGCYIWRSVGFDIKNSNTYLLNGASKLPNNTNLNSVVTPGVYNIQFVTDAQTMTNLPVATAGIVIVEKAGYASTNYWRQIFKEFNNSNVFVRNTTDNGTTWAAWKKLPANADDIIKATGLNHTFATHFGNDFAILRITQENGNYTNLTFYDSGKVEIARYADGGWKQGTILRPADT